MLAGIFLMAMSSMAAAGHADCRYVGHVVHVEGKGALVCVGTRSAPGQMHSVRGLSPAPGAPGRHPHFTWSKTGEIRIDRIEGKVAEATVVEGRVSAGNRIAFD